MKPYAFHPAANQEYTDAAEVYILVNSTIGVKFYDEIERLILAIRSQPHRFNEFSPPARRAISTSFPYSVVYLDQPDRIWIVAIMHGKRRPGYWRSRLN